MSCGVLPESLRASVNTAACTVITPPSVATPLMSRVREGGRGREEGGGREGGREEGEEKRKRGRANLFFTKTNESTLTLCICFI